MATNPADRPNEKIARSKSNQQSNFLQFPANLGAHSMLLLFNKYKFIRSGDGGLLSLDGGSTQNRTGRITAQPEAVDGIQLPLAQNIQDTYSVRVQGGDMGISASEVAGAAQSIGGSGELSASNLASVLGSALPDIDIQSILSADASQISRNAAFLGRRSVDSAVAGAGQAIDRGLGNTVNPKASLYFEGVNLKQFDFNWTLAPTDLNESNTIKNISNIIKRHVLPTYGNAVGLNKVLLNYPSTVDIYFLGIDDQYFFKYKTCMVQQFSTNYTPNGLAFVGGGKPAIVTMSMQLMEMDIHTSNDYGGSATGTGSSQQSSGS